MTSAPRTMVIVNPASAGGRTLRHWPDILAALREAGVQTTVHLTVEPGDAIGRTREALTSGFRRVVAVGGDGTLNEVVNGCFDAAGTPHVEGIVVGLIPSGTGGDFRRTLGLPTEPSAAVRLLAEGTTRTVDVGRVDFGGGAVRYFVNVADCGIGGEVVARVNRNRYKAGGLQGSAVFAYESLTTLLRYTAPEILIEVDSEQIRRRVQQVVIANGRYYGGGMHIAPGADPGDGRFDVVIVAEMSRGDALWTIPRLYRGDHLGHPAVELRHARRVVVTPADPGDAVLFDVEGEQVGRAPATVTLMPGALRVAAPAAPGR